MEEQSLTVMRRPSLPDTLETCKHLAKSGYFQDARDLSQAVTKVLAGQELGFAPIAAMTGIYIIKQKVALSANLIASLIKRHPDYDYKVKNLDNDGCVVEFFEHGETIGESSFSLEDAKRAGTGNLAKFPRNMLFARAISNGAKWFCPHLTSGAPVYTPEELGEDVDDEGRVIEGEIVDILAPGQDAARNAVKAAWIDKGKELGLLSTPPTNEEYKTLRGILGQVYEDGVSATDGYDYIRDAGLTIISKHAPAPQPEPEQETPDDDSDALDDDAYGHDLPPAE